MGNFQNFTASNSKNLYIVESEQSYISPRQKNSFYQKLVNNLQNETFIQDIGNQTTQIQRDYLNVLLNSFDGIFPDEIHEQIDELYEFEQKGRTIINLQELTDKKVVVWKGDITTLQIDGIVNAPNSYLQGCFMPFHRCIDNIIHDRAGPRLREECQSWNIKFEEPGKSRISKAYHLPCKYILHTVGPIYDPLIDQSNILESCYNECLKQGKENGLNSLAFCCVSTRVFGYPNNQAALIACNSVKQWVDQYDQIVFNVFKDQDYNLYKEIAPKIFNNEELHIF